MALILGLDGGIASVGWALLDDGAGKDEAGRIVGAGSWCFDAPEKMTQTGRKQLNAVRRQHRGQRRVLRRRRQRMSGLRALFAQQGLLEEAGADALCHRRGLDPWELRVAALDRQLSGLELALALGHVARHRGFRSNSKRDRGINAAPDTGKMLGAIKVNSTKLGTRTVAQLAAEDPDWQRRKRNRGDYTRTVQRSDLEYEARRILDAQCSFGNPHVTDELREAFKPDGLAFDQCPMQDSEDKVGPCSQEPHERRTAKRAPSFEMFRFLGKLRNLRLLTPQGLRELTPEQIAAVADRFGHKEGVTFKDVRKRLDLSPGVRFDGVAPADEGRDVTAHKSHAAEGTYALRTVLGEAGWRSLLPHPERLDRAAEVLTFREDLDRIREGLAETGMGTWCVDLLCDAAKEGRAFARFEGAAHLSAKVSRAINPGLRRGLPVDQAFAEVGYDHAARRLTGVDTTGDPVGLENFQVLLKQVEVIGNPVARKALGQMLKQVKTVIHEHRHLFGPSGLPDRIHVELARDVGKGQEERDKITRDLDKRTTERKKLRDELVEKFPGVEVKGDDLLRYELWKEQCGFCLYSNAAIPLSGVMSKDGAHQVDHILPWARFGDDSFRNKTLCTAKANQDKKGRTPFEWLGPDKEAWTAFTARVEGCKEMRGGKKGGHYLRRNAEEVEKRFRTRNLNDTRYACRVLLDLLARLYPAAERGTEASEEKRRVYARPGALTSRLRQAWGLEGRKKGPDGKRLADDRHHALDAMVVAACSEAMLQRLTDQVKATAASGGRRLFAGLPEPWPGFREQAHEVLDGVFPARPERRRARGEAHAATIKRVEEQNGQEVVYARKPVDKLTLDDLARIKDAKGRNAPLVASLQAWIEAKRPAGRPPLSPKGDVIRKVRVATKDKVGVPVRGGTADRGEMVRVDVFQEERLGKPAWFHLVPIYPHQVADAAQVAPPDRAVVVRKPESEWTPVANLRFAFSLYPNSLVTVTRGSEAPITGYFRKLDRSGAQIDVACPITGKVTPGIGSKTLLSFRKLSVDRLGRISDVPGEVRTWRGAACT